MSRGFQCIQLDEMAATWAIGQALNYIALDLLDDKKYHDYDSARNAAAESFSFFLADLFKKSKYYE